jgi:DNA-binding transcriptional regulator YiaG/uncharacterized phage-associated protein
MKSPIPGKRVELKREKITETFRKESFPIWRHYYQDLDSGETFTTDELDELNSSQLYNQYRSNHHIPFPAEIAAIRQQYGLSASKMSEVLDFGINSYRNYENGEIPSLANAKLIRLAKKPRQFLLFLEEKKDIFSAKSYQRVMDRITELMTPDALEPLVDYIWNHETEASPLTGYVKPSFEKVANFVLFFAEKLQPLKTKLNKLLFYSDFLNFQRTGYAISGCNYRAITLGPVPSHFSELFGLLEDQGYVQVEHEVLERGVGERFVPAKSFDPSLFSEKELQHMAEVAQTFESFKTTEIVNLSHEEQAWLENQEKRNLINFQQYGFELKGLR